MCLVVLPQEFAVDTAAVVLADAGSSQNGSRPSLNRVPLPVPVCRGLTQSVVKSISL